jgi:YbbR domain-containing protein
MEFVIWNRVEPDKIDITLTDNTVKVLIDGKEIFSKLIEKQEDMKIYEDMLDDIEKINEVYISGDEVNFQKLSEEFLEKLKVK